MDLMLIDENRKKILEIFNKNFPLNFQIKTNDGLFNIEDTNPIYEELTFFTNNKSSSLPYFSLNKISWITIAPSLETLREMIEILRNWIIPSFAWEEKNALVTSENVSGEFAKNIIEISPHGYFKWSCHKKDLEKIICTLKKMRFVNSHTPKKISYTKTNLSFYREQFAVAISTGDIDVAFFSINEINKKQLDLAKNTLSMEIRAHEVFENYKAIVEHKKLDFLLSFRLPTKIKTAILISFYEIFIYQYEKQCKYDDALASYKKHELNDKLAGLLNKNIFKNNVIYARMSCYEMILNNKYNNYQLILELFPNDEVLNYFKKIFDNPPQSIINNNYETEEINISEPDQVNWNNIIDIFKSGNHLKLINFNKSLLNNYEKDNFKIGNGEVLLELFTDNDILKNDKSKLILDDILYSIIDLYICDSTFPQNDNSEFYNNLLDIWMMKHIGSLQKSHTQLFLIMIEAILMTNINSKSFVLENIQKWWHQRPPVKGAVDWLGCAIEIYIDQTADDSITPLWYDGVNLIKNEIFSYNHSILNLWIRLGKRLKVDDAFIETNLIKETDKVLEEDVLKKLNFKKIAIVSLQENSAKSASLEIKERTGADVIIINKNAAGDLTESAKTADVILYVWASAKHSIYRAFDNNRDLLQYVQGTGSASIIRTLENYVLKKIENN